MTDDGICGWWTPSQAFSPHGDHRTRFSERFAIKILFRRLVQGKISHGDMKGTNLIWSNEPDPANRSRCHDEIQYGERNFGSSGIKIENGSCVIGQRNPGFTSG